MVEIEDCRRITHRARRLKEAHLNTSDHFERTASHALEAAHTIDTAQYSTFYVDGLFFGVEVLHVQEVLRFQEMTRIPLAPPTIQGLINLRGQIVTAVDMRRRLGLHPRNSAEVPMNVVLRSDEGAVSLLVDEIGDVVDVADDCREPVPENISGPQRELLTGVAKLDKKLLLILDTRRLLLPDTRES